MKAKIFMILALWISSSALYGQTLKHKGPAIALQPDTLNMGELYIDEIDANSGKVEIWVKNSGSSPLILRSVKGCCGTNVKSWPKAPILPGKKGAIKVEFRIEPKMQRISRTVTIVSNALNKPQVKVPIVGVVVRRKSRNEIAF